MQLSSTTDLRLSSQPQQIMEFARAVSEQYRIDSHRKSDTDVPQLLQTNYISPSANGFWQLGLCIHALSEHRVLFSTAAALPVAHGF